MAGVRGTTGSATERQGYHVITESGGLEYHTVLRRVDDEEDDDPVVEPADRWTIDQETNDRDDDVDVKATETVVELLQERGVEVA